MAKKNRVFVRLQSSASPFFYTAKKSKTMQREGKKLSLRKYDPITQKHELFTEKKLK